MSRRGLPEIPHTDAPRGTCRWCGKGIQRHDGVQDMRRRWHPPCLAEFLAYDPQVLRAKVRSRDRGVCAACGVDTAVLERQMRAEALAAGFGHGVMSTPTADLLRGEGYRLTQSLWEMDHITPLADGGENVMVNLQTLCQPHHRLKTARENSERAKKAWSEWRKERDGVD